MAIHLTDAIVLRRYPFRETSLLVTCLTRDFGKLKGLIKGIRGPKNRYRSAMEPLTANHIVFYDTRESDLHLISQCELLQGYDAINTQWEAMRVAAFCAELTDAVMPLEEPNEAVYRLLEDVLQQLAIGQRSLLVLRAHYVLRLLRLVGFDPQLDECVGSGQRIEGQAFWSYKQGGLLSAACLYMDPQAEPVEPGMVQALVEFAEDHYPPDVDERQLQLIQRRADEFLAWRLDRPLKTAGSGARWDKPGEEKR
jgi:DNA repair protein RecO (recombination protein O)